MAKYSPSRVVFAERCFQNTEQKSNIRLTLKDSRIIIKMSNLENSMRKKAEKAPRQSKAQSK